jgi:hypothetical protein
MSSQTETVKQKNTSIKIDSLFFFFSVSAEQNPPLLEIGRKSIPYISI